MYINFKNNNFGRIVYLFRFAIISSGAVAQVVEHRTENPWVGGSSPPSTTHTMKWIYLIIAIITEVIATSALKESEGFTKAIPSLIVIIGYSLTFYFMSLTLRDMSVGITYAIWSGMGILLITLIGYFRYNQMLDAPAVLGMSLIALGIIILRFFSNSIDNI